MSNAMNYRCVCGGLIEDDAHNGRSCDGRLSKPDAWGAPFVPARTEAPITAMEQIADLRARVAKLEAELQALRIRLYGA